MNGSQKAVSRREGDITEPGEKRLSQRRITFALFAMAFLFSMIREWSLPVACLRPIVNPPSTIRLR
jgi:hypothetical protein